MNRVVCGTGRGVLQMTICNPVHLTAHLQARFRARLLGHLADDVYLTRPLFGVGLAGFMQATLKSHLNLEDVAVFLLRLTLDLCVARRQIHLHADTDSTGHRAGITMIRHLLDRIEGCRGVQSISQGECY
jgi:hypothetical protein